MSTLHDQQIERLEEAKIALTEEELRTYLEAPDLLSKELSDADIIPLGYKRCGGCKQVKKLYLFNRNASSRLNCTGNCKECQKSAAKVSYGKNKDKRDYKKYYAENKERKRAHSRTYYQNNREAVLAKQKEYRQTEQGKEIMNRAHSLRKKTMRANAGIPYTREIVIDRDSLFIKQEHPLCCLCNELIMDHNTIHMEHLIPITIGGPDCFSNVACAHDTCNLSKSKDAHEITVDQIEAIERRAEQYIDAHPNLFPDFK